MPTTSAIDSAAVAQAPAARGLAAWLGQRVAALRFEDLGAEALHWAHVGLLDTVGVTLAGSRHPAALLLAETLEPGDGPALVFGRRQRTGMLDAAAINGAAAHALDFDDCNNTLGGHPSAPVLSALFGLADALGSSGQEVLTAYVAGFEVEAKLGMAVNMHHYNKGWHPTATLGVFGAAAASARLMGLDAQRTAVALAVAASCACGLKANFGTMTKPMHVGHAARSGLLAARLAAKGWTANDESVFEHPHGFLEVFNGHGHYDAEKAIARWAAPWDIVDPGIAIKQYPCCGSTHPAIDAMLAIVRRHAPRPQDVLRIEAAIHSRRLQHTDRPAPASPTDAKFSLQYVMARALLDGGIGVADFEGGRHLQPEIQALLPRIRVEAYDRSGAGGFAADNHFGGYVKVTLRDGREFVAQVDQPLGRTSHHPLPEPLLREKFRLCASMVLREDAVAAVADRIWQVERLASMRQLSDALASAAR